MKLQVKKTQQQHCFIFCCFDYIVQFLPPLNKEPNKQTSSPSGQVLRGFEANCNITARLALPTMKT